MIKRLGEWPYRPEDRFGRGGYAEIFRCRGTDSDGKEICGAIKILRNPTYANTLQREVDVLQALAGCPHTPPLLDYGRNADGLLCIVTGLVEGEGLERRIKRDGAMDEATVLAMIEQLLQTLEHAHKRGWLHKDLKASNILVSDSSFHLLDWGIAEPIGNGRAHFILSKNQDAVAPECYFGQHGVASDFYQLGLLAWHALMGKLPYHLGTEMRRDYRVAAHCLERPVLQLPINTNLQALLQCWINKEPGKRLVGYDLAQMLSQISGVETCSLDERAFLDISTEGYILASAHAGVPYAMIEMAERLEGTGQLDDARNWLEQAANTDYAPAKSKLAELMEATGNESAASLIESMWRDAAAAGLPKAQFKLAERLRKRGGNNDEIRRLLQLAAGNGVPAAQYRLARDMEKSGAERKEALVWFARAAERGHNKAQERLAYWAAKGTHLP